MGVRSYYRSGARKEVENTPGASSSSGFQSGARSRPKTMSDRMRSVDTSLTWKQYASSVMELVLMFGCLGFAFATSLRASHHQTVHDEEIETLNYELVEAEEDLERFRENWNRIESKLIKEASSSKGELVIPLSLIQQLSKQHLFSAEPAEKASEVSTSTQNDSTSTASPLIPAPLPLLPFNPNDRVVLF